jgi:hypothetical protein
MEHTVAELDRHLEFLRAEGVPAEELSVLPP